MQQKIRGVAKKRARGRPPGRRDVHRVTVALEPEVYEVFKKMSEAAAVSLARTIGDWCRDTAEGAQFVTQRVIQARQSPAVVMRDMHAGAAQRLNDQVLLDRLREGEGQQARLARSVSGSAQARRPGGGGEV